jgi:hypothetical protein
MSDRRSDQEEALILFAAAMDAVGVEYMVTGSTALNFYAEPRLTRDIDIVVEVRPEQKQAIAKVLSEDFGADPELVRASLDRREIFNVVTEDNVKIDVIVKDRMVQADESFAHRNRFDVGDHEIIVIGPEDLVLAKLYWARESKSEMQIRDIQNLLASQVLDLDYIEQRVKRLGLIAIWREVNTP